MKPTDAQLVAQVLQGEQESYGLLVERHQEQLYRSALSWVGDADLARDLVQDAFVKGYTHLASCADPSRFGAWIYRMVINRCKDHLKSKRSRHVSLDALELATPESSAEQRVEQESLGVRIYWALDQLPEAQREAFLLKHVEDLSYEEMAEYTGVSISALKMRVMRAREALQDLLRNDVLDEAM